MVELNTAVSRPIYGRICSWEEAQMVLIAVPWEGGVSFRRGTAKAPNLIQTVSSQIDFYRSECPSLEHATFFWVELPSGLDTDIPTDTTYENLILPYVAK
ncbi:MAG: arginase family protein, partial [Bacteroidia bacterium]|nr:arginase family protein [Bacteroidia bacterium]